MPIKLHTQHSVQTQQRPTIPIIKRPIPPRDSIKLRQLSLALGAVSRKDRHRHLRQP